MINAVYALFYECLFLTLDAIDALCSVYFICAKVWINKAYIYITSIVSLVHKTQPYKLFIRILEIIFITYLFTLNKHHFQATQ